MKVFNITTKNGQKELLKSIIKTHNLGYEKDEENLKQYNEGYIQALKDILRIDFQRFILDNKIFTNQKTIKED